MQVRPWEVFLSGGRYGPTCKRRAVFPTLPHASDKAGHTTENRIYFWDLINVLDLIPSPLIIFPYGKQAWYYHVAKLCNRSSTVFRHQGSKKSLHYTRTISGHKQLWPQLPITEAPNEEGGGSDKLLTILCTAPTPSTTQLSLSLPDNSLGRIKKKNHTHSRRKMLMHVFTYTFPICISFSEEECRERAMNKICF